MQDAKRHPSKNDHDDHAGYESPLLVLREENYGDYEDANPKQQTRHRVALQRLWLILNHAENRAALLMITVQGRRRLQGPFCACGPMM